MTARAKQKELNTLASVPIGLVGRYTTIELINDAYITGRIVYADAMMNLDIVSGKYVDGNGGSTFLKQCHIKGRKIRYIHIPEKLNVLKLIEGVVTPKAPVRRQSLKEKIVSKRDIQTMKRYYRTKSLDSRVTDEATTSKET